MNQNSSTEFTPYSGAHFYPWDLDFSDPRTAGWLFVDSPTPTIIITLAYLIIVWIGPKLMRDRKPFDVKYLMIFYNFALVLLNLYISSELLMASLALNYNYLCEPCRQVFSRNELRITNAIYWFYISKMIEFADSFFFILRKKESQLTFLHIYHHSTSMYIIIIKYFTHMSVYTLCVLFSLSDPNLSVSDLVDLR